jgi:hypothetical protein
MQKINGISGYRGHGHQLCYCLLLREKLFTNNTFFKIVFSIK